MIARENLNSDWKVDQKGRDRRHGISVGLGHFFLQGEKKSLRTHQEVTKPCPLLAKKRPSFAFSEELAYLFPLVDSLHDPQLQLSNWEFHQNLPCPRVSQPI